MKKNRSYEEEKVKNQFTAYVVSQVRGRRRDYLLKQNKVENNEGLAEDFSLIQIESSVDDELEILKKEKMLEKEQNGIYPKWDELENMELRKAVDKLNETEKSIVTAHIYEELSFRQVGVKYGIPRARAINIYYYAIEKIKREMGDNKR